MILKLIHSMCWEIIFLKWLQHLARDNNIRRPQVSKITVYPNKYAHGFVVLCFVVVMQWFIMNSHEVFIHIHQGCFAGTGAIVRLPQCQWSKTDGYGEISQCITTTKHSKAKIVCIFLGIYCKFVMSLGVYCLVKASIPWPLILDLIHHLVWHSCRETSEQLRTSVNGFVILVPCFPSNASPFCMTGPNIIIIVSAVAAFTNMV